MELTETRELIIKYRLNNDQEAFNKLLNANIKLIYYFINKFRYFGLTDNELKSDGLFGFYKAVVNYDYERMPINTFSTYLGNSIKNEMLNDIRNRQNKISRELLILDDHQYNDSKQDRIDNLEGMNEEDIFRLATVDENQKIIIELLSCLNDKQREIIINRYGLGCERKKITEIARMLNCSKQSVSSEEHNALKKMRRKKIIKDIY